MTKNTLPPDSTKSEKAKPLIGREPGLLEKLSLLSLIIPLVIGFIHLFFSKGDDFFFFFLPLLIFLPIASIFALTVQFYREAKKYPTTPIRYLILILSTVALTINCLFWSIGLMIHYK
jgi:hypothetical protein